MRKKVLMKVTAGIIGGALLVVSLGQGCSKWTTKEFSADSSSTASGSLQADDPAIMPNTATVGLVYGKQILDHYSNCLGSGLPTERTMAMYSSKQGSISESGAVSTLTAPMLMASTSIAGEVCKDLIEIERSAPRIFMGINLSATSVPAQGMMQDAMRRIARSCWSRDEDSTESQIIMDGVNSAFSGVNGANTAHDAMLFMCTSMLSSLDSLVL